MIVIVDSGVANLYSITNALEYIGCEIEVSSQPEDIRAADKLVLPGVGAFAAGMRGLGDRGLISVLNDEVINKRKPILGICLGFQLMAQIGYEDGEFQGLGWIPGVVKRLNPTDPGLKVPHVGFNSVRYVAGASLFAGLPQLSDFYFVHSYYLECEQSTVAGLCDYGGDFVASVQYGNVMGTQFHPEKSQSSGLRLLQNFAML